MRKNKSKGCGESNSSACESVNELSFFFLVKILLPASEYNNIKSIFPIFSSLCIGKHFSGLNHISKCSATTIWKMTVKMTKKVKSVLLSVLPHVIGIFLGNNPCKNPHTSSSACPCQQAASFKQLARIVPHNCTTHYSMMQGESVTECQRKELALSCEMYVPVYLNKQVN